MQSEVGEYLLKVAEAAYQNGYYAKACETFSQARTTNEINHSPLMSILVQKNMCMHGHTEKAAAELYLETALSGDRETYAYLLKIHPEIFMMTKEKAVALVLEYWEEKK